MATHRVVTDSFSEPHILAVSYGLARMSNTNIRSRITKAAVDQLKPGQTLRDVELKGFGVRRQRDAASYFLQRKINGRLRWITIGLHGSPWTPETARREAMRLLVTVSHGDDPLKQRKLDRNKPTVAEVADKFIASHGPRLKPRTREEYTRLITRYVKPWFGNTLIADVSKSEVAEFHSSMAKTPSTANFAFAVLSKLMRWSEDMGYRLDQSNPCRGIKKYKQRKHERFLSQDEFLSLGRALESAESNHTASLFAVAAIRLLILTGARLNEILTLQWRFVDFERRLLLLPDSKTGQKAIRLSHRALDILHGLPRVKGNPHVIVGSVEGGHMVNLQKPWRRIREQAGLDDVRLHDLRHTFASVAAATGASLPMIGALLGHTQPQTTQRYAHLAEDPLKGLNQKVGDVIAAAMGES